MEWVVALIGTLSGTILGWLLQFIRKRKLYINKFEVRPKDENGICNAYFKLNAYNSSQFTKAIRNPRIVCYHDKEIILEENVQKSKLYKDKIEKEKAEEFSDDISLIEISAHGNISQYCRIEFFKFECVVTDAYFVYEDEKFRIKRKKISWNSRK